MYRLWNLWLMLWATKKWSPMNIMRQWSMTGSAGWDMILYQRRKDECGRWLYHIVWDKDYPDDPVTIFCAACVEEKTALIQDGYVMTPYGMFPWDSVRSVFDDYRLMVNRR